MDVLKEARDKVLAAAKLSTAVLRTPEKAAHRASEAVLLAAIEEYDAARNAAALTARGLVEVVKERG